MPNDFIRERSMLLWPSLRVRGRFRATLPKVKAGEFANAARFSQRSMVGFSSDGSPTA
jgi:hypothetical protein